MLIREEQDYIHRELSQTIHLIAEIYNTYVISNRKEAVKHD